MLNAHRLTHPRNSTLDFVKQGCFSRQKVNFDEILSVWREIGVLNVSRNANYILSGWFFKELTRRCEAHLLYYLLIVEVGCLCFQFFCHECVAHHRMVISVTWLTRSVQSITDKKHCQQFAFSLYFVPPFCVLCYPTCAISTGRVLKRHDKENCIHPISLRKWKLSQL